jgi:hypothetical protein
MTPKVSKEVNESVVQVKKSVKSKAIAKPVTPSPDFALTGLAFFPLVSFLAGVALVGDSALTGLAFFPLVTFLTGVALVGDAGFPRLLLRGVCFKTGNKRKKS